MNHQLLLTILFVLGLVTSTVYGKETNKNDKQEGQDEPESSTSWWSGFKSKVKSVVSRWREDLRVLWDDVLAKARDMRGWTAEVLESLKVKLKEWVESRPKDVLPDDEKNEIETFIMKLKVPPAESPAQGAPETAEERKKLFTDKKIDP